MKIVVLILASALIGAGGVVVKDEVQSRREQETLLRELDLRLRMAQLQLEMVRTQEEEVLRMLESGAVDQQTLESAQAQVRWAELDLMRLLLDQEEVRESGEGPRNDVSAPLVGGRDFVTERLRLLAAAANDHRSLAEGQFAYHEEMRRTGLISAADLSNARLAREEAETRLRGLHLTMNVRERFLSGEISAAEAERQLQVLESRNEIGLREMALEGALHRLQLLESQAEAGAIGEPELRRARLEVMRMQMELDLVRLRLEELLRPTSGQAEEVGNS